MVASKLGWLTLLLCGCGGAQFGVEQGDASPANTHDGDAGNNGDAMADATPSHDSGSETDSGSDIGDAGGDDAAADARADDANDAAPDGGACITDLSGVGTGDFRIAFTVTTTGENEELLDQRPVCSWGPGGFWDINVDPYGKIVASTGDGSSLATVIGVTSSVTVSDGVAHHVVVSRTTQMLGVRVDGIAVPSVSDADFLGSLPPLQQGTSVCVGKSSVTTLDGTLTDVCITRP
jgi:hypothetical protein